MPNSIHIFQETERIKEPLCIQFFETCIKLQNKKRKYYITNKTLSFPVSYKELMKEMHIGRERFQRLLNCVERNEIYFKLEKGFIINTSNIVSSIDWSKRFIYKKSPIYHIKIERYHV